MAESVRDNLLEDKKCRKKFCWNCLHYEDNGYEEPCLSCHGIKRNGERYCYKNWKEGIDYVES